MLVRLDVMTVTHTTRPASSDEIAAEMDRRGAVIEKLEAKLRLVDQDRIHRGKMLKRIRDMLVNPRDHLDDAGDLVSFGSTNDADTFRDAVQMLEDWRWDDIMREGKLPDLVANCRKANERADAAEAIARGLLPVLAAAKAISDRNGSYVGHDIIISCESHGEALRLMRELRDAIAKAEGR